MKCLRLGCFLIGGSYLYIGVSESNCPLRGLLRRFLKNIKITKVMITFVKKNFNNIAAKQMGKDEEFF
jgi:hypothetical protein